MHITVLQKNQHLSNLFFFPGSAAGAAALKYLIIYREIVYIYIYWTISYMYIYIIYIYYYIFILYYIILYMTYYIIPE
jgi:hypothetical protein